MSSKISLTGFQGYTSIFELFQPNELLREMIASRQPAAEIRKKAIECGMVTLKIDGIKKAFQGLTTVEEVLSSL